MNYRLFTSVRKIYYLCILNSNYYAGILERSELNSLIISVWLQNIVTRNISKGQNYQHGSHADVCYSNVYHFKVRVEEVSVLSWISIPN